MGRISTSDRVKERITNWLRRLLKYANDELQLQEGRCQKFPECADIEECQLPQQCLAFKDYKLFRQEISINKVNFPHLVVRSELKYLTKLLFPGNELSNNSSEQLRHDLRVLAEFMGILVDNRDKTRGAAKWHFTIELWFPETEDNIRKFAQIWDENQNLARKKSALKSSLSADGRIQGVSKVSSIPNLLLDAPDLTQIPPQPVKPLHNLPVCQHGSLIGRKLEVTRLLELLSDRYPHLNVICIQGLGGVGKTALALEVAHRCLQAALQPDLFPETPRFEAIIFTSAQTTSFIGSEFTQKLRSQRNLQDVFRTINQTLDGFDCLPATLEMQVEAIYKILKQRSCLLIIDNIETLAGLELLGGFLQEIPPTVKVLLTSRLRTAFGTNIELKCLDRQNTLELISQQAQQKGIELSDRDVQSIYPKTGGLPLSIAIAIGRIAVNSTITDDIPVNFEPDNSDLLRYCFEDSFRQFQRQPAERLLIAIALFPKPVSLECLAYVALATNELDAAQNGISHLYRRSLAEKQQDSYTLHSITRRAVGCYWHSDRMEVKQIANRRIQWYLQLTRPFSVLDWQDWQDYTPIDLDWENLRAAIVWCQEQERYADAVQFWHRLKGFTLFRGYWLERLQWLDWLIASARQHQDIDTEAEATYHKSRTLAHIDQSDPRGEAIAIGMQAWQLSNSQPWQFQFEVAIFIATLYARKQEFKLAQNWCDRSRKLLQAPADSEDYLRRSVELNYCQAEIYWRTKKPLAAKDLYREALERAKEMNWEVRIYYIQAWMAVAAMAAGEWKEAETLLEKVLPAAEKNRDYRSLAYCQRYFALLERQRQNADATRHWAESARTRFERLHMSTEAAEMQALLQNY